jgi:hypothetical protein
MTHDELEDGTLMKTWTAIDVSNLLTVKEAWQQASEDGWLLEYHRYAQTRSSKILSHD